jgi:hypothetical protein
MFRRPEFALSGRIFDFWRGLVHGDPDIASNPGKQSLQGDLASNLARTG